MLDDTTTAILAAFLRDLPSTGVLILFIWLWSKQVSRVLELAEVMLTEVNGLLRDMSKTPRS